MNHHFIYISALSVTLLLTALISEAAAPDSLHREKIDSALVSAKTKVSVTRNFITLSPQEGRKVISVSGIPDIMRQISVLPGISAGVDGTLGQFVRGGNEGGMRVELAGVPVYRSSHLMGLLSSFDSEALDKADFSYGSSAKTGNYSSSALSLYLKQSDKKTQTATLSPYMSGFCLYTPADQKKYSKLLSARISPALSIAGIALKRRRSNNNLIIKGTGGISYDILASIDRNNPDKWNLNLAFFSTMDEMYYNTRQTKVTLYDGNHFLKAGARREIDSNKELNILTYVSLSHSGRKEEYENMSSLFLNNLQAEAGLKADYSIRKERGLTHEMGTELSGQLFDPHTGSTTSALSSIENNPRSDNILAAFYYTFSYHLPDKLELSAGLRPTLLVGKNTLSDIDVHARANYSFLPSLALEMSADRICQYNHLLEGLPTGWSHDLRVAADKDFPQEITTQFYAGLANSISISKGSINLSAGYYYRKMDNLVTYTSAINIFGVSDNSWKSITDRGKGWSSGIESGAELLLPRMTGRISYTFSRTKRQYPQLNRGEVFYFRFDRPHILNLQTSVTTVQGRHKGNAQVLGLNVSYSSGNLMSAPVSSYEGVTPPSWKSLAKQLMTPLQDLYMKTRDEMQEVNNFRLPNYFRIDISYIFEFKTTSAAHELELSVFNITNRHNAYQYFFEEGKWKQLSFFPIMPSIRWVIRK